MSRFLPIIALLACLGCSQNDAANKTALFPGPSLSVTNLVNAVYKGRMSAAETASMQRTSIASYYRHLLAATTDDEFRVGSVVVSGVHTLLLEHASSFQTLHKNFATLGSFAAKSAVNINVLPNSATLQRTFSEMLEQYGKRTGPFAKGNMGTSASVQSFIGQPPARMKQPPALANLAGLAAVTWAGMNHSTGLGLVSNSLSSCAGYESTVNILGGGQSCTGVAIADDTVITAAHCIHGSISARTSYGASAHATSSVVKSAATGSVGPDDLAVVHFAHNTFKITSQMGKASAGESVKVAGYGSQSMTDMAGIGSLSCGNNVIPPDGLAGGMITLGGYTGSPMDADDGTHSLSTQGDSGGGLFNQSGQVTAITSGGNPNPANPETGYTHYVDLSTPSNQDFIQANLQPHPTAVPMETD